METVHVEEMVIRGVSCSLAMKNRAQSGRKIHDLWVAFYTAYPEAFESPSYGVYTNYSEPNVATSQCDLLAGSATVAGGEAITIPAGNYLRYRVAGQMPNAVIDGWNALAYYLARPDSPRPTHRCNFEKYISEVEAEIYINIDE